MTRHPDRVFLLSCSVFCCTFYPFRYAHGLLGSSTTKAECSCPSPQPRFHYADDMPPVEEFGLQSFWCVVQ